MWSEPGVRAEFSDDFESFSAYLKNSGRASSHTSKTQRYTKEDVKKACEFEGNADPIRALWESDPALRAEFDGDYAAYESYEGNKDRVKTLNR